MKSQSRDAHLLLRHIEQHRILKTPGRESIVKSFSKIPIWKNPPIFEKVLLNAFANCTLSKQFKKRFEKEQEMLQSVKRKQGNINLSRRRTLTILRRYDAPKSNNTSVSHNSDITKIGYMARTSINTPSAIKSYTNCRSYSFNQRWGMNVLKMPLMLSQKSLLRPQTIYNSHALSDRKWDVSADMQYRPIIIVKKKSCAVNTVKCEPLTGW